MPMLEGKTKFRLSLMRRILNTLKQTDLWMACNAGTFHKGYQTLTFSVLIFNVLCIDKLCNNGKIVGSERLA